METLGCAGTLLMLLFGIPVICGLGYFWAGMIIYTLYYTWFLILAEAIILAFFRMNGKEIWCDDVPFGAKLYTAIPVMFLLGLPKMIYNYYQRN